MFLQTPALVRLIFFFSGQITIRIDTLWAQLLLEFSSDHFKTMHTCSTRSVDVHVVLGISSSYFFYHVFLRFRLSLFFQVRLLLEYIPCGRNSS